MAGVRRQADKRRHSSGRLPVHAGEHRAHARPPSRRLVAKISAAGLALPCIVAAVGSNHRTDDGKLVHHLRHQRELVSNTDSGDICRNLIKLATNLLGGIRLEIPHVLVRRTTRKENVDDSFVAAAGSLLGLRAEELGERQATHGQAADGEKSAARKSVAEVILLAGNR